MSEEKKPMQTPIEDTQEQENTEAKETPAEEEKPAQNPAESETEQQETEQQETPAPAAESQTEQNVPPALSEVDALKEENFRLTTQLEAMNLGFVPEVIEDAVILAENIVKKDGSDISAALKTVAKKYPAWTAAQNEKSKTKGGFKVGADSSGGKTADDDKLDSIFGIRKKK